MLHYYICLRAWFRVFIHTFLKCILPLLSMHKPSRNKSCRRRVEIPHIDLFRNWQCQDYCASIATFPNLFPISLQVARQLVACSMHFSYWFAENGLFWGYYDCKIFSILLSNFLGNLRPQPSDENQSISQAYELWFMNAHLFFVLCKSSFHQYTWWQVLYLHALPQRAESNKVSIWRKKEMAFATK